MEKYTLRIDSKDRTYKKLIKLPTTYYKLINNKVGEYTLYSYNNLPVLVDDINSLKLKWNSKINKIVLYHSNSAIKVNGNDFTIEQEALMSNNNESIIKLKSGKEALVTLGHIQGSGSFGLNFFITNDDGSDLNGTLNSINFYDDSDPILQDIIKKTDGLYVTIEDNDADHSRNVHMSDKDGKIIPEYDHYQYRYKSSIEELAIIDNLTNSSNTKQKFVLEQGQKLSDGIYEAKIVLDGKHVATLPEIGYHILGDEIIARNYITKDEIKIPRDFHYLKTIKLDNDDYKLTFCNFLGNEFFEYKKYDPQYYSISDKHKVVNPSSIKNTRDLKLHEYAHHAPIFFAAAGLTEPGSQNYAIDLFELAENGKGEKVGTLADEFGYLENNDQLKYHNYHEETEHIYDLSTINIEMAQMKNINSEFYLMNGSNIITLHTIPELL